MSRWARRRTGGRPGRIRAGYTLGGKPLVRYGSMAYTAPFAVAAMSDPAAAGAGRTGLGRRRRGAARRLLPRLDPAQSLLVVRELVVR